MNLLALALLLQLQAPVPVQPIEGREHLSRFFAALSAREHLSGAGAGAGGGESGGLVRITHIGDSHLAADLWSGRLRVLFQARFGDGGRGFVLAGKPWRSYWQSHVRGGMEGDWRVDLKGEGLDDGFVGPGTCAVACADPTSWLTVGAPSKGETGQRFTSVAVFFARQQNGGCFALRAQSEGPTDGAGSLLGYVSTRGPFPEPAARRFEVPPGTTQVSLRPLDSGGQAEVRVLGFSLENQTGAVWDALGVNGAQARALLKQAPEALAGVLRPLGSTLVVLSFGTNELYDRDLSLEAYTKQLTALLRTIRGAAPQADCLITGPFDLLKGRKAPALTNAMIEVQRTQAQAHGCGFWDARRAMGGPGSIRVWRRQALAQADFVHLTRGGYERMGDLLNAALMEGLVGFRGAVGAP